MANAQSGLRGNFGTDTPKPQRDTLHKLFTPTIIKGIARAAYKAQTDDKLARRAGAMLALKDVAEFYADVFLLVGAPGFDRIRFLKDCGVR